MNDKPEVFLTEVEVELMAVLVKYQIFSDSACALTLVRLAEKLV